MTQKGLVVNRRRRNYCSGVDTGCLHSSRVHRRRFTPCLGVNRRGARSSRVDRKEVLQSTAQCCLIALSSSLIFPKPCVTHLSHPHASNLLLFYFSSSSANILLSSRPIFCPANLLFVFAASVTPILSRL